MEELKEMIERTQEDLASVEEILEYEKNKDSKNVLLGRKLELITEQY